MFLFFPDVNDAPFNPMEAASRLTDWVVDLASNGDEFADINRLTETVSEFPRSKDAPEGDGRIVQVCDRLNDTATDLLLFDGLEIEKGPIAEIQVPIRLRFGLHGNFAPSEEIGLAA